MGDRARLAAVRTTRLTVRPYAAADEADVRAVRTHPTMVRWTRAMPDEWFAEYVGRGGDERSAETGRGWLGLAVVLRDTGRVVGEVGLWVEPDPRTGDLGYLIHPDHQRLGYATEAAGAALGLAFGPLGLGRVTAGCDADNVASVAVMRRLGMRRAADGSGDDTPYALAREQWQARQTDPS